MRTLLLLGLTFLEELVLELVTAYDDHTNMDADEISESLDALAEKLSKVTHNIPHRALLITMDRVHDVSAAATQAVRPLALPHVEYITGEAMAGAVNDIGIAADFRCASCFTIGIAPMAEQQSSKRNSRQLC